MTTLYVLADVHINTDKALNKAEHYLGGSSKYLRKENLLTHGLAIGNAGTVLFISMIVMGFAQSTPYLMDTLNAGTSAFAGSAAMLTFGGVWRTVRGSTIDAEKKMSQDMKITTEVVNIQGKIVILSEKEVFTQLKNGTFYNNYNGIVSENNAILKPASVKEYLSLGGVNNEKELKLCDKAVNKITDMDTKTTTLGHIVKMRVESLNNALSHHKKNDM